MRVRLTSESDGRVAFESRYQDFSPYLAAFKAEFPWDCRTWDSDRKRWVITALYAGALVQFLERVGAHIVDDRPARTEMALSVPMPDDLRHAYDVLGLQYSAPIGVAEASYRFWAKETHPDRGGNPEHFHTVQAAIETIRRYIHGGS